MIREINVLRLLFMLMIFVHHVNFDFNGGGTSVAAFFIIGGFCMTLGYEEKVLSSQFSYSIFIKKRIAKFYPVHWFSLILFLLLVNHYVYIVDKKLWLNVCLLQAWIPRQDVYYAYNSPSWYLCDSLFFALLFPWIIRGLHRFRMRVRLFIMGIVILLNISGYLLIHQDQWQAYLYVNPISRIPDCLVGVYLAWLYKYMVNNRQPLRTSICDTGIVLSLAAILSLAVFLSGDGCTIRSVSLVYWIPESALLLFVALRSQNKNRTMIIRFLQNKFLQKLSVYSMSFYLLHSVILNAYNWMPHPYFDYYQLWYIKAPVALVTTFVVSFFSYNIIENKFKNLILQSWKS